MKTLYSVLDTTIEFQKRMAFGDLDSSSKAEVQRLTKDLKLCRFYLERTNLDSVLILGIKPEPDKCSECGRPL